MIGHTKKIKNPKIYKNKNWLIKQYIDKDLYIREIGRKYNISKDVIYYWIKKHGIKKQRVLFDSRYKTEMSRKLKKYYETHNGQNKGKFKEPIKIINLKVGDRYRIRDIGLDKYTGTTLMEWVECPICGKKHWVKIAHNKPINLCCILCGKTKRTPTINKQGYEDIWIPPTSPFAKMRNCRGRILVHRLNMARYLDRCLKTEETVHHIDHNTLNNDIPNLKLFESNGPHLSLTILENKIKRLEKRNHLLRERINELETKIMVH
jgi:predicted DNA-binding protein YlxM (UPF0122 family)